MTAGLKILAWRVRAFAVAAVVTLAMGVICGAALVVGILAAAPLALRHGQAPYQAPPYQTP